MKATNKILPGQDALASQDLVSLVVDEKWNFVLALDGRVFFVLVGLLVLGLIWVFAIRRFGFRRLRDFDIDEAEFGIGDHKLKLRPNDTDRQIAYKIWVELSTRKIGLPIDLEDDVIFEIYNSWYNFFDVTRELIKDVPVVKFNRSHTERIIKLSIDVLNNGVRPHLTKWQARFRRWYERELNSEDSGLLSPQEIQRKFPNYEELSEDLLHLNSQLMRYRSKMYELVTNTRN